MQIPYYICVAVAIYIKAIKETEENKKKKWNFPDYSQCCPLCGAKDCAVRIGFYLRKRVVIYSKVYTDFPIPRWLCQQKGPTKPKHRTFSLLPHFLIPYCQYDLDTLEQTLRYHHQNSASLTQTKDYINEKGKDPDICLENKTIHDFQHIFKAAFSKLNSVADFRQRIGQADYFDSSDPVATVLGLIEGYQSQLKATACMDTSNAEKLALDFFFTFQTACYFERHFLFGTPSQKR